MPKFHWFIFVSVLLTVTYAHAVDVSEIQSIVRSRICPGSSEMPLIKTGEYCKEDCTAGNIVSQTACFSRWQRCYDEAGRLNDEILKYNDFVRDCKSSASTGNTKPSSPLKPAAIPSKPQNSTGEDNSGLHAQSVKKEAAPASDLERRLARSISKLEGYEENVKKIERQFDDDTAVAQQAYREKDRQAAAQQRREDIFMQQKLEECSKTCKLQCVFDINALKRGEAVDGPWPIGWIRDLEANCSAQCLNNAEMCRAKLKGNKDAEASMKSSLIMLDQAAEDLLNNVRNYSPRGAGPSEGGSSGWSCFPDYAMCTNYCRQAEGGSSNGSWCGGICSEQGTGNLPKPSQFGNQRCYHPQ
jgi:hypothetical protein